MKLWIGAVILVVGTMIAGRLLIHHYTDAERIRAVAEAYLQQYANGKVTVGSASFSWVSGVHLRDVSVHEVAAPHADRDSSQPAAVGKVFSCRQVRLEPNLTSTIAGNFAVYSITAYEPTCAIVRNRTNGRTNLSGLLSQIGTIDRLDDAIWPIVELRDARIKVIDRDGPNDQLVEDLRLNVRGQPSHNEDRHFNIVWQSGGRHPASGHSQIDLQTGRIYNVQGGLPWMSIEAVMIAVNAQYDAAGTWCDLLGLDGAVRATDYDLYGGSSGQGPPSATIELNDASLSIPINDVEVPLSAEDRYIRFKKVNGRIALTSDEVVAEFDGRFHGSPCRVAATFRSEMNKLATLDDVSFDARVNLENLELPHGSPDGPAHDARFVNHWTKLAKFFVDYDPHGVVDLEVAVTKRAGEGEPIINRRMLVTAKGADASYRRFPYRLTEMRGSVELTPDGIFLHGLTGVHDGGTVTIDGVVAEPRRCSAVELSIKGSDVPIDEQLAAALPSRYENIQALLQPEGRLNIELDLARPGSADGTCAPWASSSTISFDDLSARHVRFPYPLRQMSGAVRTEANRLRFDRVVGFANDAPVEITGTAAYDGNRLADLEMSISALGVPFSDELLTALPLAMRGEVAAFHPEGRFDVAATLTREPVSGSIQHVSEIRPKGMSVTHERFPVTVDRVEGKLVIDSTAVRLEHLRGVHGDTELSAVGTITHALHGRRIDVDLIGRGVTVDDALLAACPPKLQRALSTWRVEGPLDATVHLARAESGELNARMDALLSGASIHHDRFPLPFRNVHGQVTVDADGARADDLAATYGRATVRVDFDARRTGTGEEGVLRIVADGLALDDSLRDALPSSLQKVWKRLGLSGRMDLRLDRLDYRRPTLDRPRVWSVGGMLQLHDAAMTGAVDIARVHGTIHGEGYLIDPSGGTALTGTLALAGVDVFERQVNDASGAWTYASVPSGEGRLVFDSLTGRIYDGALTAEIDVVFEPKKTSYSLSTTVQDMNVEPFLSATAPSTLAEGESATARGLANARIYLQGDIGNTRSKQGGGRVAIVDGQMYRLPIMLAILHVINLSIPEEEAFHDVSADFHVVGDRVDLDRIVLQGPALALAGSGAMSLPDRGLDLNLVNISPHDWARLPGLTDFVEGATRTLVELHVTGPASRPTVRAKALPSVGDEFKSLFKRKEAKKIRPASAER